MANATIIGIKAGRNWDRGSDGLPVTMSQVYLIDKGEGNEAEIITEVPGLPKKGEAHPTYTALFVSNVSMREGDTGKSRYVEATVTYSREGDTVENNPPLRGADIQSYGWTSSNVSRDLLCDVKDNTKKVQNSAGQPFDRAPQYDVAVLTFRKVVKTYGTKDWAKYINCINSSEITVDGVVCAPHTLRCTKVDREKLWGDDYGWTHSYTLEFQLMKNLTTIENNDTVVDIGWDVAITDAGCYTKDGDKLTRISYPDEESGQLVYAQSPQLLNGAGGKLTDSFPYNIRYQCYIDTTFDSEMFSDTVHYRRDFE